SEGTSMDAARQVHLPRLSVLRRLYTREGRAAPQRSHDLHGGCSHGHEFTRENTMINSQNQKVCRTCKQKPDARPRSLKPGEMDEILKRARRGETTYEIS